MALHKLRVHFLQPLRGVRLQFGHIEPITSNEPLPVIDPEPEVPEHVIEPIGELPDLALLEAEAEQRGYDKALVEQGERVRGVLDALQADLQKLQNQQDVLAAQVAESVEDIAFSIAERVTQGEIDRGNYDLPSLVAECFAPLSPDQARGEVMVCVSREDFQSLDELLAHPDLEKWRGNSVRLEIEPELGPSSCRVVAGPLVVTTDAKARLEMVRRGLNLRGGGRAPQ